MKFSDIAKLIRRGFSVDEALERVGDLDFEGNKIVLNRTTEDAAFLNFKATADADATSAVSTNTTSGATTHHIQIEINGVTAWIAVSTTDPT